MKNKKNEKIMGTGLRPFYFNIPSITTKMMRYFKLTSTIVLLARFYVMTLKFKSLDQIIENYRRASKVSQKEVCCTNDEKIKIKKSYRPILTKLMGIMVTPITDHISEIQIDRKIFK